MKTKILSFFSLLFLISVDSFSQDEEVEKGFKKENIFIGSALNLSVGGSVFQIGANPEIGYSITKWLDAGISTNLNYTSIRYTGASDRVFNYGAGTFVRIWPVRFLFVTAVPEYNWIKVTTRYTNGFPSEKQTFQAGSLLLGAGYGGRVIGNSYSYLAIMFDALDNENSPYRDYENRAIPVLRAGFAFYLGGGKRNRY